MEGEKRVGVIPAFSVPQDQLIIVYILSLGSPQVPCEDESGKRQSGHVFASRSARPPASDRPKGYGHIWSVQLSAKVQSRLSPAHPGTAIEKKRQESFSPHISELQEESDVRKLFVSLNHI